MRYPPLHPSSIELSGQDVTTRRRSHPPRLAHLAALGALAAGLLLAPLPLRAAPAPATPSSGFQYGAHAPMPAPYTDQQETQTLDDAQASGAGWVRFELSWEGINTAPGVYDYTRSDSLVRQANQRGLKVLGTVLDTPDWASSAPGCPNTCSAYANRYPPANFTDWRTFVTHLATHYAQACQTDSTLCVHTYEIWNEPTQSTFWQGTPEQYAQLLSLAYDAIHAADPQAVVMNGGVVSNTSTMTPDAWLQRVMTNSSYPAADKLDVVAIHERGPVGIVQNDTAWWRAQFNQYGALASKPLWVTEHGYPSTPQDQSDPRFTGTDPASGQALQAQYYSAALPALAAAGASAVFVTTTDSLSPTQGSSFANEGLFLKDLTSRKPAFTAYRALATGTQTAPLAPSNLVAKSGTMTITLSWTDNATNESGYVVERQAGSSAFAQLGSTLPAQSTSFTDTTIQPNVSYTYRVKAINPAGSSAYASGASATVLLLAPTNLHTVSVGRAQVALAWTDNATNESGYVVERQTGSGAYTQLAALGIGAKSYTDRTVQVDTVYSYRVKAINGNSSSAYSNAVSVTMAPAAPTNLAVTGTTPTSVSLSWTDTASTETSYVVERKKPNTAFSQLAALPAGARSYTDPTVVPGVTYSYRVKAVNATGSSSYAGPVSAVPR